jgi:hypothetical protein
VKRSTFFAWLLLASPAFAEGQYEHAKPSPQCLLRGMQAADQEWLEDPAETARILATYGRVARLRAQLRLDIADKGALTSDLTLVNFVPTGDNCPHDEGEFFKFEGLAQEYAVISLAAYEEYSSLLINMTTGSKTSVLANDHVLSPSGRFLTFSRPSYVEDGPPLAIFDISGPLQVAQFKTFSILSDTAIWQDDVTLRFTLLTNDPNTGEPDSKTARPATLTITRAGIEVRVEQTGETFSAPFEPVSLQ